MAGLTDQESFARLVRALEPYLGDLVFVGGWAHRLLALHEYASPLEFQPLATDDADLAAHLGLRVRKESIAERLKAAGFHEEFRGEDSPPISEYHLGEEDAGLYVEFLAPLLGGATRRDGRPDTTALIGGVTAQKLRHIDLLLEEPWVVRINEGNGFPLGRDGLQLRVPNPATFIAQKLLVLGQRAPAKRAKDILYVHDTLILFANRMDAVRLAWMLVRARVHQNVQRALSEAVTERFGVTNDLVRDASRIAVASGRPAPPSADRIAALCRTGLGEVFAD